MIDHELMDIKERLDRIAADLENIPEHDKNRVRVAVSRAIPRIFSTAFKIGYAVQVASENLDEASIFRRAPASTKKKFFVSILKASKCLYSRRKGFVGKIVLGYSIRVRLFGKEII